MSLAVARGKGTIEIRAINLLFKSQSLYSGAIQGSPPPPVWMPRIEWRAVAIVMTATRGHTATWCSWSGPLGPTGQAVSRSVGQCDIGSDNESAWRKTTTLVLDRSSRSVLGATAEQLSEQVACDQPWNSHREWFGWNQLNGHYVVSVSEQMVGGDFV